MVTIAKMRLCQIRLRFANDVVQQASAFGAVPAPSLTVKRMVHCYAAYDPFRHRVTVAEDMLIGLSLGDLRALLAHEIGHAVDRRQLRRDSTLFIVPFLTLMLAILCVLAWTVVGTQLVMGVAVHAACIVGFLIFQRFFLARWKAVVALREEQADAFAAAFLKEHAALDRLSAACKFVRPS